jgi:hypothetical protein
MPSLHAHAFPHRESDDALLAVHAPHARLTA